MFVRYYLTTRMHAHAHTERYFQVQMRNPSVSRLAQEWVTLPLAADLKELRHTAQKTMLLAKRNATAATLDFINARGSNTWVEYELDGNNGNDNGSGSANGGENHHHHHHRLGSLADDDAVGTTTTVGLLQHSLNGDNAHANTSAITTTFDLSSQKQSNNVPPNRYSVRQLVPGEAYQFRVRACSAAGCGPYVIDDARVHVAANGCALAVLPTL